MVKREDKRPEREQVASDIRAQIMAGEFEPGQQLPSTSELVERFGVAGTTIQKALGILKDEGFLMSRQGKGVFVRDRQPFRVPATAYFPPSPGGYSYEILDVSEVAPPTEVAQELGLSADDRVIVRKRLMRHGGDPVELDYSYYPADLARGTPLARNGRIRGGSPRVLAELGYPQDGFVDRVSSRMPTSEEIEVLDLPQVPVIRQFRIMRSVGGRTVEVSVLVKGAHLYEVSYQQSAT